jgi:hypothetical protein
MASDDNSEILANLRTRLTTVSRQLADMSLGHIGDKPDGVGPGSLAQHIRYRESLLQELRALNTMIDLYEGPVEYRTQAW